MLLPMLKIPPPPVIPPPPPAPPARRIMNIQKTIRRRIGAKLNTKLMKPLRDSL